jgi:hypothetical protein
MISAAGQLRQQRTLPDRVGSYSKRIGRALPGKHTKTVYDALKRREADIISQAPYGNGEDQQLPEQDRSCGIEGM